VSGQIVPLRPLTSSRLRRKKVPSRGLLSGMYIVHTCSAPVRFQHYNRGLKALGKNTTVNGFYDNNAVSKAKGHMTSFIELSK
jgi:hypothetical protein